MRCLFFKEDGYQHIKNGVRVVEFTSLDRDLPRKLVARGLEIGFWYTGQPIMCFCCSSTEHVVKDCPKARNRIPACDPVNSWRRGEAVAPVILPAPTPGSGDKPSVMDTRPSEPSSNSQNSTSTADDPVATQSTLASPSLTLPRQLNPHRNYFRQAPRPARVWAEQTQSAPTFPPSPSKDSGAAKN